MVQDHFGDSSFPPLHFKWGKCFNIKNFGELGKSHLLLHLFPTDENNISHDVQRHGEKNWVTRRLSTRNTCYVPTDPCFCIPVCWTPLPQRAVKALVVIWMISCRFWQFTVTVECYVNLTGKGFEFRRQMFVICMYWLQRTLGLHPIGSCISL